MRSLLLALALVVIGLATSVTLAVAVPHTATAASTTATGADDPEAPVELIKDGGFEETGKFNNTNTKNSNPYWSTSGTNPLCSNDYCPRDFYDISHEGNGFVKFESFSELSVFGSVYQSLVLPAGRVVTLSYDFRQGRSLFEPYGGYVDVLLDGHPLKYHKQVAAEDKAYDWTRVTVDLTAFADGESHTLKFQYSKSTTGINVMLLDDVSVQARQLPTTGATLQDGGFEATSSPWLGDDSVYDSPLCTAGCAGSRPARSPRTGNGWAGFRGTVPADGTTHTGWLAQRVVIPESSVATLSYGLADSPGDTTDPEPNAGLGLAALASLELVVDDQVIADHRQGMATDGYELRTADLRPFADGEEHVIMFRYLSWADSLHDLAIDDVDIELSDPPTGSGPTELLRDGGFETSSGSPLTNDAWTTTGTAAGSPFSVGAGSADFKSYAGSGWAGFVSRSTDASQRTASISQEIRLPARRESTLTYAYLNGRSAAPYDGRLRVLIDGRQVDRIDQTAKPSHSYRLRTVDLSRSTNGGTHTLTFEYTKPSPGDNAVALDGVSIQTSGLRIDRNEFRTSLTVPYSNTVPPWTLDASSGLADSTRLTATATGLPAGVTLDRRAESAPGDVAGEVHFRLAGAVTGKVGTYPVTIDVTDGVTHQPVTFTMAVTPIPVSAQYTGPTAVAVEKSGTELTLSATVRPGGAHDGDLRTATATFTDTVDYRTLCTAPVAADGTASCTYLMGPPPTKAPRVYQVRVDVGGNYTGHTTRDTALQVRAVEGLVVTAPSTQIEAAYSDAFEALVSATSDRVGASFSAKVVHGELPAGVNLMRTSAATGAAWKIAGSMTGPPGVERVLLAVSDGVQTREVPLRLLTNAEQATPTYLGPDTAVQGWPVTLSARVAQDDDTPGDLDTATVTFVDADHPDVVLCRANVVSDGASKAVGSARCDYTADRTRTIRVTVGGRFAGETTHLLTVTPPQGLSIVKAAADALTAQYSDPFEAIFSATSDRAGATLSAKLENGTLPAGLTFEPSTSTTGVAWKIAGTVTGPLGSFPVTFSISDGVQTTELPLTIIVTAENAKPTYTGPTTATEGWPVSLSALVTQDRESAGDLGTATVTFTDADHPEVVLCLATVTQASANKAVGTARCDYTADHTRTVRVTVGGRFTGRSQSPLTVTPPKGLSITRPASARVEAQYSDGVDVTVSAGSDRAGARLSATLVGATRPKDLALTPTATEGGTTWILTGIEKLAPATYPLSIRISDRTERLEVPVTVVITREDATVAYDGPTSARAGQQVELSAKLEQNDDRPGDVSRATVTFLDTDHDVELCTAAVATDGTASCPWTAARSVRVAVRVDGSFTGETAQPVTLTVTPTSPDISPTPDPSPTRDPAPVTTPAPDTTLTNGPGAWLLATSTTFAFSSAPAGATFVCTLDAGTPVPCASPYPVSGLSPTTHVMTIAATRSGQFDPTPVRVVFTVPKDANAWTTKGHGWKRSGTHAVFGSAWATRAKGEALIATVTDATQLALVVGRSPHAGRVKVFLGGRLVGVVSLKGAKGDSAIVPLAPFPAARSGKLRIVTANARLVRIAGLGIATAS
ncbi:MAG TPA: hypothetical protein PLZ93_02520 [Nocardioides sp.]|uniref:hypothetical protein n=1 Tax=uncultured Nocardioides sp. TaxID=198441 RepID=UPI002604E2D9|nr:hypothetical protein [uncultured Nocardioides sp.]HRD59655.1 hypothetical protein [Nocardioides sp.]HRI94470.1 hypothetical protein [Nocardioides sp.]HRK44496.1 hypothetical protein [Nocardioides sp.]